MVKVYIILACYIIFPILIIEAFKRWTIVQKIGTVVLAYAVGIIASLCGVFDFATPEATASFSKLQSTIIYSLDRSGNTELGVYVNLADLTTIHT